MRKLIDIPDIIYKKIQHISVDENTNPKKWIENLIDCEIKKRKGEKIKSSSGHGDQHVL